MISAARRRLTEVLTAASEGWRSRLAAGPRAPDLAVITEPRGERAESVRALCAHVLLEHIGRGRRGLVVCAASAGSGATVVAGNLAAAIAQAGVNTVLIDADLRDPGLGAVVARRGPGAEGVGMRQLLSEPDAVPSDFIDYQVMPRLSVLRAGGAASNPQELLAGDRFEETLSFCLREFDFTVVDTPPTNICADALRVSNLVGYSLIVARKNRSFVDDVRTSGRRAYECRRGGPRDRLLRLIPTALKLDLLRPRAATRSR